MGSHQPRQFLLKPDLSSAILTAFSLTRRGARLWDAKLFASRPCALVSNNSTLTAKTIAKRFADGGAYISQERIFLAGEYAVGIALKRFGSAPMLWLASDEIGELAEKMLNEASSVGEAAGILILKVV